MTPDQLHRSIHAFDPSIPIERAVTPPADWYTEPAVEQLERRAVWGRSWQYVCRSARLAAPGAFVSVDIAGQPYVVVRGGDGVLRALHNVCRHKAAVVCTGHGHADELVCPYHGWKYHLDGRLKSAPKMAGIQDFDRAAMSLPELRVAEWGPWVFVNAQLDALDLLDTVAPLDQALRSRGWSELVHRGSKVWNVECNWKAFCDNYLDGGYHIPNMHPSLDAQLDMDGYETEIFGRFNVQRAPAGAGARGLSISPQQRIGDGALYAWVYPNFMINRYGPVLDINIVRPTSPDTCEVTFEWWFHPSCDPGFVAQSQHQTDVTQREDIEISVKVQRGLRSDSYTVGRYAPTVETGIHHFHQLLSADLRGALQR